ncbi:hypothetical protein [Candidatus Clavichlamydia salmonicola]|uniref:hypothetical protein n=1 Tax=Candidatus Clavichlamydia salmonicola TaxID=469812 RepID=UPI0018913EF2|nr:hypothetical protein [Candidatus Clavichlamydia salmonicola]
MSIPSTSRSQGLNVSNEEAPLTPSSPILQVWREIMQPAFLRHYQDFLSRGHGCFTCNFQWVDLLLINDQPGPLSFDLQFSLSDNFTVSGVEKMKKSKINVLNLVRALASTGRHNIGPLGGSLTTVQLTQLFGALLLLLKQQTDYKIALLHLEPHISKVRDIEKLQDRRRLLHLQAFLDLVLIEIKNKYLALQGAPEQSSPASFLVSCMSSSDRAIQRLLNQALSTGALLTRQVIETLVAENLDIIDFVIKGRQLYLVPSFSGIPYSLKLGNYYDSSATAQLDLLPLASFVPNYREMLKDLVIEHICSRCIS